MPHMRGSDIRLFFTDELDLANLVRYSYFGFEDS